jgi:hypothetical protein
MLGKLDTSFLLFSLAIIGMLSFFIGNAINALIKDDAYGVTGNTIIVTAGFVVTVEYGQRYGLNFRNLQEVFLYGLAGAFAVMFVLAMAKIIVNRRA